jgi:hypothetical protein
MTILEAYVIDDCDGASSHTEHVYLRKDLSNTWHKDYKQWNSTEPEADKRMLLIKARLIVLRFREVKCRKRVLTRCPVFETTLLN